MSKPQRSKRLTSFKEFAYGKSLSKGFLAGFKRYVGKDYMTDEEWQEQLTKYQNRSINTQKED
jgi:hypothetical protein